MTSATGSALYRLAVGHSTAARQKDLLILARTATGAVSKRGRRLCFGAAGVLIAVAVIPATTIVALAYVALAGAGLWAGLERTRAERSFYPPDSRWLTGRRVLAGTAAATVVGLLALLVVPPRLIAFLLLAVCVPAAILTRPAPQLTFWKERSLIPACIFAGIVKETAANGRKPKTRRHGQPVHTAAGTRIDFELIADGRHAVPCDTFIANRAKLAGAFRLDPALVEISHPPNTPASMVRMFVGLPRPNLPPVRSHLATAERTEWDQPFRVGAEMLRGTPVDVETDEHNILIAGMPGRGKTRAARLVIAQFILDPRTRIFGLDGKGSARDYRDLWDLCDTFVRGTSEDAAAELADMLDEVLNLVRTRNSTDPAVKDPGVLLILEEFQDVRSGADKKTLTRIDATMERLVRLCRAVELVMLFSTQRPSVEDLPGGVRDLIDTRFALAMRNAANAKLILGETPTVPLPAQRGEAIMMTPGVEVAFRFDYIDDADWRAICDRARALRALGKPKVVDLESAVVDILTIHGPLTAKGIHDLLDPDLRPPNPTTLGLRLAKMAGSVERYGTRNGSAYRLAPPAPKAQPLRAVPARHAQTPRRIDVGQAQTAPVWKEGEAS